MLVVVAAFFIFIDVTKDINVGVIGYPPGHIFDSALMANIIVQIANNEQFREDMKKRIGKAVDTSEYEEQAERLTKQIRNKTKTLKRKALTIDNFDWDVKNADSLYDSLNEDYVRLHDEVKALEGSLEEVEGMIEKIKNQLKQKDTTWSDLTHRL